MNSSPQQQLQPQLNSTNQPPSSQTEPNPSSSAAAGVTSTSLSSQLNRTANSNLTQFVGGILTNDLSDMISLTNTLNNSTGSSANARNYTAHRSNGVAAHTHSHGHEQQPNSDQVILNLIANGSGAAPTEEQISNFIQLQQQQQQQQAQPEQDPNAAANGNIFVFALKAMQSSIPFLVILVAKIFHQHLLGFFIVLGFLTTLHWSNKKLVGQVEVKDKKQNRKLVLIIAFLLLNVAVFFYNFADYKLENW